MILRYFSFLLQQFNKYGLSVDGDVGLWLEKRELDGEPDLDTVGNGSFVVFKDKFQQYTRRGFSMMPQNELIHYWNSNQASPSLQMHRD